MNLAHSAWPAMARSFDEEALDAHDLVAFAAQRHYYRQK